MGKQITPALKGFVFGFLLFTVLLVGISAYALPYIYGSLIVRAKERNNYISMTTPNGITKKIWTYKKPDDVRSVLKSGKFYYATTPDGRQLRMIPTDRPNADQLDMAHMVALMVSDTLSVSYSNREQHFTNIRNNYSEDGWESLQKVLQQKDILSLLHSRSLYVLNSSVQNLPAIQSQSIDEGQGNAWVYTVPVVSEYAYANGKKILKHFNLKVHLRNHETITRHPYQLEITNMTLSTKSE